MLQTMACTKGESSINTCPTIAYGLEFPGAPAQLALSQRWGSLTLVSLTMRDECPNKARIIERHERPYLAR